MSRNPTPNEAIVAARAPRYTSIDLLKASGIIVVIWIHAFQEFGTTEALIIRRLAFLTRFAVPAFFFASGFLYASGRPLPLQEFVTRRLVRLLVPYLVASLLALGFRHFIFSEQITGRQAAFELAIGAAWGVYYFVPLLLGATIVGQGIFRFRSLAWPLFALFWVLGLLSEMSIIAFDGFFWQIRSPFLWWGYFFAGWVVAPHFATLEQLTALRRRRIGIAALAVAVTVFLCYVLALQSSWSPQMAALGYVGIYSIIGGLFMLTLGSSAMPAVRWLSEATYPIYLYHYFIIAAVHHWLAPPLRNPAAFVLGVAGSVGIVHGGRKVLGRYARLLIG
ncbi:MAG: Acyltransferase family [Deltaproteobacteria bacterium]|jgi:peptidoglycan/LPS O-acetylase OafA/YrhL|nr:Acyltransferase family [Deltaproteobacteria bacterium]